MRPSIIVNDVIYAEVVLDDAILALRHKVLRSHLPLEEARLDRDDDPRSAHFVAMPRSSDEVISCVSYHPSQLCSQHAWRLQAMASKEEVRRQGIGFQLFSWSERLMIERSGISNFWCDARIDAVPFYGKNGWVAISDVYVKEPIGKYQIMAKKH